MNLSRLFIADQINESGLHISGSFDKRLLIRDDFITCIAFYRRPEVTISDKRVQNKRNDFGGALNVYIK